MDSNAPEENIVSPEEKIDGDNSTSDHLIEEKKEDENITTLWQSSSVPVLGGENVLEETHVEDATRTDENAVVTSTRDVEIREKFMDDLISNEKSNVIGEVKAESRGSSSSSAINNGDGSISTPDLLIEEKKESEDTTSLLAASASPRVMERRLLPIPCWLRLLLRLPI